MYFPSEEERRYVLRGLLPEVRQQGVSEDLRGWSWDRPPLKPAYDAPLAMYEVAGKYCASGRDVYLRRVQRVLAAPNRAMLEGRALHQVLARMIIEAKRLIYEYGAACIGHLERLRELPHPSLEGSPLSEEERKVLGTKMGVVRAYEARRIVERVESVLARQPHVGPDGLVALALPVSVEVRLSGRYLGLSEHLAVDAITFAETIVADVKFGPREEFHRLGTTGYALVLESLYEAPVNIGCIVYVQFRDDRLVIERDLHIIGDELRRWFIDERDEKMRLVSEEWDPGLPAACYPTCPYLLVCNPTQQRAQIAPERAGTAKRRARSVDEAAEVG